jgi:hypothetical protein
MSQTTLQEGGGAAEGSLEKQQGKDRWSSSSRTRGMTRIGEMQACDQAGSSAEWGAATLPIDTALRRDWARGAPHTRRIIMTERISRHLRDDCPVHSNKSGMHHDSVNFSECCCFFCPYHDQCDCIVRRIEDLGLSDLAFGMDIDSCINDQVVVGAGAQMRLDKELELEPRILPSSGQSFPVFLRFLHSIRDSTFEKIDENPIHNRDSGASNAKQSR